MPNLPYCAPCARLRAQERAAVCAFRVIKPFIRERDKGRCGLCPPRRKSAYALQVHHIDFSPLNNDPTNLLLVCVACHNMLHSVPAHAKQWDARYLRAQALARPFRGKLRKAYEARLAQYQKRARY